MLSLGVRVLFYVKWGTREGCEQGCGKGCTVNNNRSVWEGGLNKWRHWRWVNIQKEEKGAPECWRGSLSAGRGQGKWKEMEERGFPGGGKERI